MKVAAWCVAVALAIIAIVIFWSLPFSATEISSPPALGIPEDRGQQPVARRQTVILPVAETAASLNSRETTPEDDIATLDFLISSFRKHEGGNPVGENDEITAALLGNNPKSLGYLRKDSAYIDPEGRLIDRWGTPYFFHALSGERMEILSAGPDLKHHNADDLRSE